MSESENCPKCDSVLPPRYATGRVVCKKCGWTDQPQAASISNVARERVSHSVGTSVSMQSKLLEQALSKTGVQKNKNFTHGFGLFLFIVGSAMIGIGLIYDPTVSSGSFGLDRTYNIGAISNKSTYTNTGGFIAICGAIFMTRTKSLREEGRRESQEDKT